MPDFVETAAMNDRVIPKTKMRQRLVMMTRSCTVLVMKKSTLLRKREVLRRAQYSMVAKTRIRRRKRGRRKRGRTT